MFWAVKNPHVMRTNHTQAPQKVIVCLGIIRNNKLDLFFDETVNETKQFQFLQCLSRWPINFGIEIRGTIEFYVRNYTSIIYFSVEITNNIREEFFRQKFPAINHGSCRLLIWKSCMNLRRGEICTKENNSLYRI